MNIDGNYGALLVLCMVFASTMSACSKPTSGANVYSADAGVVQSGGVSIGYCVRLKKDSSGVKCLYALIWKQKNAGLDVGAIIQEDDEGIWSVVVNKTVIQMTPVRDHLYTINPSGKAEEIAVAGRVSQDVMKLLHDSSGKSIWDDLTWKEKVLPQIREFSK